jgi:hypothetical protein
MTRPKSNASALVAISTRTGRYLERGLLRPLDIPTPYIIAGRPIMRSADSPRLLSTLDSDIAGIAIGSTYLFSKPAVAFRMMCNGATCAGLA